MKTKKILKAMLVAMGIIGLIFAIGVVGRQDREYYEATHQAYQPKGGFVKVRR